MTNAASRQKASNAKNATAARADTKAQQSKQQMQHSVGASFVLRLVLGLAPEKRAACQTLREILNLDNNARLELAPTTKGLKPISGKSSSSDWSKVNQYKVKHMVKQAQSDKFQEAMQQLGGQHLYDVIRTQLKQIGGAWDDRKDKPSLLAKNTRPRSNSIEKNVLPQKEAERRKEQPAKGAAPAGVKGQIQAGKKNQSMESPKIPPPAPATVKLTKNTAPGKKSQVKNATPVKNALPVKAAPLMGAWAGPIPASIVLSRPSAIVSSAPAMSSRAGNGGRAILSRAI